MHLLFWLSLIPFVTGWMGENSFANLPVATYGVVLWFAGFAYYLLTRALVVGHGIGSVLAKAIGQEVKERISLVGYAIAIPIAFFAAWVACAIYVLIAILWLIPDQRIERALGQPVSDGMDVYTLITDRLDSPTPQKSKAAK